MARFMPVEQVLNEFNRIAPFIYKLSNLTANPDVSAPAREIVERIIVTELQNKQHRIQMELKLSPQQIEWTTSIPHQVTLVNSETQTSEDDVSKTDSDGKLKVGWNSW